MSAESTNHNIAIFGFETSSNEERNAFAGISEEANKAGWNVLLFNALKNFTNEDRTSLSLDSNIFKLVNYDIISGVIIGQNIMSSYRETGEKLISICKEKNIPIISMGVLTDSCPSYVFNNYDCIEKIVDHLIEEHNCKTFALMAGAPDNDFSIHREEAFKASLKKHNLEFNPEYLYYGYFWEGSTKNEMNRFFKSGLPLPDAFVCCNDVMAMAVCEELKQHNYEIPKDVIVTGYDGLDSERYYSPRITTAKCDIQNMGREVFNFLIKMIEGEKISYKNELFPNLIFSESCGCKPSTIKKESKLVFEAMGMIGEFRHTNDILHNFSTEVSSCEKIQDIKKIIPQNIFQTGDLWILLNKEFLNIQSAAEYPQDNPFDDTMISFLYKRNYTIYENIKPISKTELIPFLDDYFKEGAKTLVLMDLYFSDKSIGYMAISHNSWSSANQLDAAERFSQTLSQNLSLVRNKEKVDFLIYHDLMTGIYNRRGFYHSIKNEIQKRIRTKNILILHSIDMDSLKYINDTYGHKEGDFAIVALSNAIIHAGSKCLIAARFGGDEFVAAELIEENADVEANISVFRDKIHDFLDKINATSKKKYKVECSIGSHSTIFPPEMQVDQIIAQADELMYNEKSTKKRHTRRD